MEPFHLRREMEVGGRVGRLGGVPGAAASLACAARVAAVQRRRPARTGRCLLLHARVTGALRPVADTDTDLAPRGTARAPRPAAASRCWGAAADPRPQPATAFLPCTTACLMRRATTQSCTPPAPSAKLQRSLAVQDGVFDAAGHYIELERGELRDAWLDSIDGGQAWDWHWVGPGPGLAGPLPKQAVR